MRGTSHQYVLPTEANGEAKYVDQVIDRANAKYKAQGCEIVYLDNPDKINRYLKDNRQKLKIGLLVKNLFGNEAHYTPLYVERRNGKKYFVQLDSVHDKPCNFFLTATSALREFYYSPFPRQAEGLGCIEDGVKMLSHCFMKNDMIEFCEKNREKFSKKTPKAPASKTIFKLTSLPSRFLTNIERYDTLRHFIKNEPGKLQEIYKDNETVYDHIVRKGKKRPPDGDPEHKDDIRGKSFLLRRGEYAYKAKHPSVTKKELKKALQEEEEREVAEFVALKKVDIKRDNGEYFFHSLKDSWFDFKKFVNPQIGTPIHFFAEKLTLNWTVNGNLEDLLRQIENFIFRDVDINARDGEGSTVLTSLFRHGTQNFFKFFPTQVTSSVFVEKLVNRKADPHIKDSHGKSALDYARENKNCPPEMIELLERGSCLVKLPLPEEKKHEQKNIFVTDYKKLFAGLGFIAAGVLTLSASTLLLAVTCGAAAPALLVSISLVVSMTGIAGGFVGVPLLERFGNKDSFNARMAAGSVVAGAGVGATTVIPQVSQAMGLTASNVSQVSGLMGGTAATTAAGSAAFVSTMVGIGAGVFAAFVLVMEGVRLIKSASKVSQNSAALFAHRPSLSSTMGCLDPSLRESLLRSRGPSINA